MTEIYHKEHFAGPSRDGGDVRHDRAPTSSRSQPRWPRRVRRADGPNPQADTVTYEAAKVGGVPGWWCRTSEARPGAAILYFHGGAYVVGSAQAYRNFVGQIAVRAKVDAFIPDYALAPERPFPAAVDDGEAAYRGLVAAGISRIAIVGDSAGGGLALATATRMTVAARERYATAMLPANFVGQRSLTASQIRAADLLVKDDERPVRRAL